MLGENILLHYVVRNTSDKVQKVSAGGDYRGASRAQRIRVVATDAAGNPMTDPDPSGFNMGGFSGEHELEPGDEFAQTLQLHRYARIEKGGVYRVRVAHDLGWSGREDLIDENDARWAELSIEIVEPTPAQAEAVVEAMAALPDDPMASMGKRIKPFADFSALQLPIFLSALERRAVDHRDTRALRGVAAIATTAATGTLIRLGGHADADIAKVARDLLGRRLPPPPIPPLDPQRDFLVERSWRPVFAKDVRALAADQLRKPGGAVETAAAYLESVGTREDIAVLIDATTRTIDATKALRNEYPWPPHPVPRLLRAIEALLSRGATAPTAPRSSGEIATYLLSFGAAADRRPDDYHTRAAPWLRHDVALVRQLTIEKTVPLGPFEGSLAALVADKDGGVQIAACQAITKTKSPRFRRDILRQIAKVKDEWLISCLGQAVRAVGVPDDDVALAWVARLPERKITMRVFQELQFLFLQGGSSGWNGDPDAAEAARLHRVWKAFVAQHRSAIRGGKRFAIGSAELDPALVPNNFVFHRRGQSDWPPRSR